MKGYQIDQLSSEGMLVVINIDKVWWVGGEYGIYIICVFGVCSVGYLMPLERAGFEVWLSTKFSSALSSEKNERRYTPSDATSAMPSWWVHLLTLAVFCNSLWLATIHWAQFDYYLIFCCVKMCTH